MGAKMSGVPEDLVHSAQPPKAKISVGEEVFEVDQTAPFEDTVNKIARDLGIAGSFVISSGSKLMGKTLPRDFTENMEVQLLKYDAGG